MDTAFEEEGFPSPLPANILLILVPALLLGPAPLPINLAKIAAFSRVSVGVGIVSIFLFSTTGGDSTDDAKSLVATLSTNRLPASTAVFFPTSRAFLPNSFAASLPTLRAVEATRLATPDVKSLLKTPVIVSNIPAPPITCCFLYLLFATTSIFIIVTLSFYIARYSSLLVLTVHRIYRLSRS